jgi:hypothetical protein
MLRLIYKKDGVKDPQKAGDNKYDDAKEELKELNEQEYYAEEERKGIIFCHLFLISLC